MSKINEIKNKILEKSIEENLTTADIVALQNREAVVRRRRIEESQETKRNKSYLEEYYFDEDL